MAIQKDQGKPFQVFTAFLLAWLSKANPEQPKAAPKKIPAPARWPASLELAKLELEPKIDWAAGLRETWHPGEAGDSQQLETFLDGHLKAYSADRDRPDHFGTSRLSPRLHFGEISAAGLARGSQGLRGKPSGRQAVPAAARVARVRASLAVS